MKPAKRPPRPKEPSEAKEAVAAFSYVAGMVLAFATFGLVVVALLGHIPNSAVLP